MKWIYFLIILSFLLFGVGMFYNDHSNSSACHSIGYENFGYDKEINSYFCFKIINGSIIDKYYYANVKSLNNVTGGVKE